LIDGAPRVLLFDTGSAWSRLDEWKADLWSVAGIPAPPGDQETNETIVFGYLVAWFLGEVQSRGIRSLTDSSFPANGPVRWWPISMNG
jgi:glycogen(starch) synthase